MIRATKGKSRSTNHWKGGWMVGRGPKRLALRWFAVSRKAFFLEFFFEGFFFRFFSMLSRFGEGFGAQNGGQNRVLEGFFVMFFSNAFRHRF